MSLEPRLDLRQSQTLVVTPQLQQAISLLQMSALEIDDLVTQELEKNPFLEREGDAPSEELDPHDVPDEPIDSSQPDFDLDTNFESTEDSFYEQVLPETPSLPEFDFTLDVWQGSGARKELDADFQAIDLCASKPASLTEHLAHQINMSLIQPADRELAYALLEQIDEKGYLPETVSLKGFDETAFNRILTVLQGFSPTGVFARSLAECFTLQFKEQNRFDPAVKAMLDHLDLVASRDYKQLSKVCGVDEQDVAQMVFELKRFNPFPARLFDIPPAIDLIPDVLLRQDKAGNFIVELNQSVLPRVLLNRSYVAEVSFFSKKDKTAKKFLSDHLSNAHFLIKALNQRAETILKVATQIVERQKQFFIEGEQALRPMVLKDIADSIGMHESTVSRVTLNKYMATSRGVFELKYFFSQGLDSTSGSQTHSAQSVRYKIKLLIEKENTDNILSDEALVLCLKKEGVEIARRTVAKYREALGIPTSALRKREKRLKK